MSKQVNDNIGHIVCGCHGCTELAALRRDKNGKFYHDCLDCGRIAPNMEDGQRRIMERAVIWGPDGAPADVPRWIGEQWSWGKARRMLAEARRPMNAGESAQPAPPIASTVKPTDRPSPRTPAPPPPKPAPAAQPDMPPPDDSGLFLIE